MTTRLILNPTAGSAQKNEELIAALRMLRDVEVVQTSAKGDAQRLARLGAQSGCTHIIAAGGDGTVNEVLNGLTGHLDEVTLGVLPMGTGNDLSRSLGMPDDPADALPIVLDPQLTRRIDLMRVTHQARSSVALNHINAGYGNIVSQQITPEMKQRWGPFAYLASATSQLVDHEEYRTRICFDHGEIKVVDAVNIFVANGHTIAGGFKVAPDTSMEDGLVEVVIMRAGSWVDLAGMAARTLVGNLSDSEHVITRSVRTLSVASTPPMPFSVDGEPFCEQPIDIEVLPTALRVVVGPDYSVGSALDRLSRVPRADSGSESPTAE